MQMYHSLLATVLEFGETRKNRTGEDTRGIFGAHFMHDLRDGFPLLTTKKIHFKSVIYELMWFLKGKTDVKWLQDRGVRIWNEWQHPDGSVGPVYGHQWRNWNENNTPDWIDQMQELVKGLKNNPMSRRHIVTAWNPNDIPHQKLPCCHVMFQCNVTNDGHLDLQMYQRSADLFLGVPFNIASYALLNLVLCNCCKLKPGKLHIQFGDLHIYHNHFDQVNEQLSREIRDLPAVRITREFGWPWELEYEDVEVSAYDPHPSIKAEVAV